MSSNVDASYRFVCTIIVQCKTVDIAHNLAQVLEPENKFVNNNKSCIHLNIEGPKLLINYFSNEKTSTVRSTLDDILFTLTTASNVSSIVFSD